ncbi:hypothetical protein PC129_g5419 [Phytophthora cactorum]|uniref:Uncharacterized protein n=1 Tax=Phytophthora cactorum TaxID=29920 RepID=A0A329SUV5_9STRA|nr:hypothetical protein Pcac1_g14865 [Phytophthora cactorum]KAG3223906.1 hypothetical protein PC129_g5419 [Phytophthora cactorum]KAG4249451.1 hypothetical protein PC116_g2840 [Phytophthora cactorum]RAW39322.1 hypothetical protein PC110_g4462 [Phytophthora cactorum]
MVANREGRWDEDAVDGGPSSMELLLVWLRRDNNAARWRQAIERRMQATIARKVHEFFVDHGITHRTVSGIRSKLWQLGRQVGEADDWLASKGLLHVDGNEKARRTVMRLCPDYLEVAPFLRFALPRIATSPHVYGCETNHATSRRRLAKNQKLRRVDGGPGECLERHQTSRRVRTRCHNRHDDNTGIDRGAWQEMELHHRRELLRLELQIKRDQAVSVRVKIRKELLDLDLSLQEINQLLPL